MNQHILKPSGKPWIEEIPSRKINELTLSNMPKFSEPLLKELIQELREDSPIKTNGNSDFVLFLDDMI